MKLKEAIIELGMSEFYSEVKGKTTPKELGEIFQIKSYKKGDMVGFSESAGGTEGYVWHIISGRAKQIFYPGNNEFAIEMGKEEWIGIEGAVKGVYTVSDLEFLENTQVFIFPLGRLIRERPDLMEGIWEKVARVMVDKFIVVSDTLIGRMALSREAYFLKTLADNNYVLNIPTRILSERLGINLRTLQRLIKNLENKGIIKKIRGSNKIWVEDYENFDNYLDSLD